MFFKKENYRFALQECKECGAQFLVVYNYESGTMELFGEPCIHVKKGGKFKPAAGLPSFNQWYQIQTELRKEIENETCESLYGSMKQLKGK